MTRPIRNEVYLVLLFACVVLLCTASVLTESDSIVWEPWAALDISKLGDDHTGSTFVMSEADGKPALRVMPSGRSDETKLAYPVSGSKPGIAGFSVLLCGNIFAWQAWW